MSATSTLPSAAPPGRVAARPAWRSPAGAARLLAGVAVAVGVLARLHSSSTLWLDEAQSVAISRRDLPGLFAALREDGSPPVYYLLLHVWTRAFGTGPDAVRALSTVFSVATLPLVWLAGRRLGGPRTGWAALLLLAANPFAVRYATETRMYALVQLLSAAGVLVVLRALERPSWARLAPVSAVAALLALTHYFALYLLAVAGLLLLWLGVRGSRPARRALLAVVVGGVPFLPWLPAFAFQTAHTGTPWAPTPRLSDTWYTITGWGGGGTGPAVVLTLLLAALLVLGVAGRAAPGGVAVGRPLDRRGLALLVCGLGALVLGLVAGMVVHAGYALRYSSAAFLPALLLVAVGLRALPLRVQAGVLAVATVCGLSMAVPMLTSTRRTEAAVTAAALRSVLAPGDLVVYCPDQLGPAVSRLLPPATDQVVYPTLGPPQLVDWVDYAQRNRAASPDAVAQALADRARGAVLLVSAPGYLTFGTQCEELGTVLGQLRGDGVPVHGLSGRYDERQQVVRYPAPAAGEG